jgi:hypothetical protein
MEHLVKCPLCGHKHSVTEKWLGKKVMCTTCDKAFIVTPCEPIAESPSRAPKKPEEALGPKLVKKTLGDPAAALDGSIPGAFSGILAGVLAAFLVGIFSLQAFGEIIGRLMFGCCRSAPHPRL